MKEDTLQKMAALKLAIREWASTNNCQAIAIECWSALPQLFGILPCFVMGELTNDDLPVVCETDVHGAISSSTLQAAVMRRTPTFFADLTIRHPQNNNGELLWHCGVFPISLRDANSSASITEPGQGNFEIKRGDITLSRFDGDHSEYSLFMGHAKGIIDPINPIKIQIQAYLRGSEEI